MRESYKVRIRAQLDRQTLDAWVESGWLQPETGSGAHDLSDADLARARLIRDLKEDLGVNDEGVGVVLDLVDRMYGLRVLFDELFSAVCQQPDEVRRQIAQAAQRRADERRGNGPSG